jgi:Domain of unknown function (DUF4190)/Septum formation
VGLRYNPPPGWPPAPEGFSPGPGWQPDPSWPPAPPGWQLWVNDDEPQYGGSQYGGSQYGGGTPSYGGSQYSGSDPAAGQQFGGSSGFGTGNAGYGGGAGGYGNPAYGTPPAYGAPGYSQPGYGGNRPFSAAAIVSLIFGILGGIPIAIGFGIAALVRIPRRGQRGKGLAIAGLVLSGLWLAGVIAGVIGAAASNNGGTASGGSSAPASGSQHSSGSISVFSLASGDCFDNPPGTTSVQNVTAISCTSPHSAQVFAEFNLTGSNFSYPGQSKVESLAQDGCNARLNALDKSELTNSMTIHFLFPQEDAWISGQRTVNCLIVNPTPTLTKSLLAG